MQHYLHLLEEAVVNHWNAEGLCNYRGEEFTYGQMAEHIEKFGIYFEKIGLKKQERVALCARNSARWGISFLSANVYGAVVVPILPDFTPENIVSLVNHSESTVLFTDDDMFEKMKADALTTCKVVLSCKTFQVLWAAEDCYKEAMETVNETFQARFPMGFTAANVSYKADNLEELSVINYTSGTTSVPKGVMLTFKAISANVNFGQDNLPCHYGDTVLSMLPMAHMYGMMFEFLYPLCGGAKIYYLGKTPTPSVLMKAFADVHPIQIITVPLVLEKIYKGKVAPVVNKPAIKAAMLIPGVKKLLCKKIYKALMEAFGGNIRTIIMGGAALNPEAEYWFRAIGLPYTVGYGMTEGAPLFTYTPSDEYKQGSCGRIVDYCQARIDSSDPQHEVGEIQIKGPNIMIGYYNNEEATAAAFTEDGYLRTGDLGVMDPDGTLYIRGRSKNMILSSSGQNIYPEEVEAIVNTIPYFVESVVVSRENNTKLVALVYLDKESMTKDGFDEEGIQNYLDQKLAVINKALPAYERIVKIELVDVPFEKTPKMSIKRFMYK